MKNFFLTIFLFFSALFFVSFVYAQETEDTGTSTALKNAEKNIESPDVVAIRVLPNANHYSPMRWYIIQGYSGRPSKMIIDGYDAIKDGQTIYVNAANVLKNNKGENQFYTNIYVLAFNIDAEQMTDEIFTRIISNVKFNSDIIELGSCKGTNIACMLDSDCSENNYCQSKKARIVRDTKRLADLAEIKVFLGDYQEKNSSRYPELTSGTYLPNKTVSLWPSWKDNFGQELGIVTPIDPLNKLICNAKVLDVEKETCWAEKTKIFADSDPENTNISLIKNSFAYVYESKQNGHEYNLCAMLESEAAINFYSDINCKTLSGVNHPPEIIDYNLPFANSKQRYEGYVEGYDKDGDPLSWTIETLNESSPECASEELYCPSWASWGNCNSPDKLILAAYQTSSSFINTVIAHIVGNTFGDVDENANYYFKITIRDNRGGEVSKIFYIRVSNPPLIEVPSNLTYVASSTNPLKFVLKASSKYDAYPLGYLHSGLPQGWEQDFKLNKDDGKYHYTISAKFDPNNSIFSYPENRTYDLGLKVTDKYSNSSQKSFQVNVINGAPSISFSSDCKTGKAWELYVCAIDGNDPNNNNFEILVDDLPKGLALYKSSDLLTLDCYNSGCKFSQCPPKHHIENYECKSDTDWNSCAKPAHALRVKREWNSSKQIWGACEVMACEDNYFINANKTKCLACVSANIPNSTSVKMINGQCKVMACKENFRIESGDIDSTGSCVCDPPLCTPANICMNGQDLGCDGSCNGPFLPKPYGTLCDGGLGAGSGICSGGYCVCNPPACTPANECMNGQDSGCDGSCNETTPKIGASCRNGVGVCDENGDCIPANPCIGEDYPEQQKYYEYNLFTANEGWHGDIGGDKWNFYHGVFPEETYTINQLKGRCSINQKSMNNALIIMPYDACDGAYGDAYYSFELLDPSGVKVFNWEGTVDNNLDIVFTKCRD